MLLGVFSFIHIGLADILDIVVIAAAIAVVFRWLKGSSSLYIFLAILLLFAIRVLADLIGMKMVSSVMGTVLDVGTIALIVIFQPEIRRFLSRIGKSAGNTIEGSRISQIGKILRRTAVGEGLTTAEITEICEACDEMSEQKTGALIVIRKANNLEDIIATGDRVDANISRRLIMNIFFKNSPLHDGAMIISDHRIAASRCTLPITDRTDIPARFGMRHKSAIGLTDQSDAEVIVVSEQTGKISYVKEGKVTTISSRNALRLLLGDTSEAK